MTKSAATDIDVLSLSALDLAQAIRRGGLRARQVLESHIGRIEAVNPVLNAMVADRFAAARLEADEVDAAIARGDAVGPLAGVPFSVKEMISLAGMPHTLGSLDRRGARALRDATIVQRLREAGAIPLGVTNVPEWGFWFETDNLVYGRTCNPHDPRRTAGGSSGGEAAIVAAGGSAFGLGSDIGGSIRMPAAFCGVVGHKPSNGLLPLTGHYPVYEVGPDADVGKHAPYLVAGPLTRTATDLMPLLRIMAGADGIDPNTRALRLGDAAAVTWAGRRVVVLERPRIRHAAAADEEMCAAVRAAAAHFGDLGARVVPADADLFLDAVDLWAAALRATSDRPLSELASLGRWSQFAGAAACSLGGRPRVTLPLLMFSLGERIGGLRFRDLDAMRVRLEALATRFNELLGPDGVLLMPPHPRAAPAHRRPLLRPFDFAFTGILNVLRVPATVVPTAVTARGLPIAVQIAAVDGNDHLTIAAAMELERARARFRPADVPGC
jgi:fatty acid amide hydrolase 2